MFHFTFKKGMSVIDFTDALDLYNNGLIEEAREYILQTLASINLNECKDVYMKSLENYLMLDEGFAEKLFQELEKLNNTKIEKQKEETKREEVKKDSKTPVENPKNKVSNVHSKLELAVSIQDMLKNENSIVTNNNTLKNMIFSFLETELCKILGEKNDTYEFTNEEVKVLKALAKKIINS